MAAVLEWAGDDEEPVPASFPSSQHRIRGRRTPARSGELPPDIEAAIWRGNQLGSPVTSVVASGFPALDAELPGAGWPCHSLTEILQPQPTVAEWRLLAPAMRQIVAGGGNIVVVGPPKSPHLPGLKYAGLDERHLVWIKAEAPAERLWVTEQLIKTNAAGLLVSWLPQARQEQIRRLPYQCHGDHLCLPCHINGQGRLFTLVNIRSASPSFAGQFSAGVNRFQVPGRYRARACRVGSHALRAPPPQRRWWAPWPTWACASGTP